MSQPDSRGVASGGTATGGVLAADAVEPAVRLTGITKRFPGVIANSDITFTVRRGTVHALVGENGAGKSTLMNTLYGMHKPDEGTIEVDGRTVVFGSPADAIAAGIGMVHQHFMLADNLTVWENIVLGSEPAARSGVLRAREAIATISGIAHRYGLDVDPRSLVEHLGVGARQRVEILKVLYRGARTLILDEPTAVLVPQEVDELFDNLRELKREGLTIIFISHKLDEVRAIADEITVIRRGTTVGTADPKTVTNRQLAEMMVGSELPVPETRESTVTDRVVLALDGVTAVDQDGRAVLTDVSLTIHAGEILGIAGVEGNGQAELVDAIMGIRPVTSGSVSLDGADVTKASTLARREAGVGFIPEDRQRQGLILSGTLWENRILGHQTRRPASNGWLLTRSDARADTRRIVEQFDVRTPGIEVKASSLSGGNQQKLIVGREMSGDPKLLIASHPTRGVDVGAQAAIWEQLRVARSKGLAVLLISADLEELIGMSDTITVILRGRLVGHYDPNTVTPEQLGSAMTGAGDGGGDGGADGGGPPGRGPGGDPSGPADRRMPEEAGA
ncbi:MAG: heme ABC transporter ATP-binding protein [Actinobacteria bacterium 69-20]|nr:ABC transporter ATP-binding protein [Actinomycetota bacterium]OJV23916.1 MAG: heme ABC transporter ATP-binding protein [Actinobacteria bacterium 69-20]